MIKTGAFMLALLGAAPAVAQQTMPDYTGSHIFQPPSLGLGANNFSSTTIRPDYNGGYVIQSPNSFTGGSIRPDYNGGWIVTPPSGRRW